MRLTLSNQIAALIQKKIYDRPYSSLEEGIAEALNLLVQLDEKLSALRQDIQEGLANGGERLFDESVVAYINKCGLEIWEQETTTA